MSRRGKEKWQKYFGLSDVLTRTKNYDCILYEDLSGKIFKSVIPKNSEILVFAASEYKSKYQIRYKDEIGFISESHVAKPLSFKGATENLNIKSANLIELGSDKIIEFDSIKYQVKSFNDCFTLHNSIMRGLRCNSKICDEILEDIDNFLNYRSNHIWNAAIDSTEINELGKYLGELIYGMHRLKHENIEFCVPVKSNNQQYDSFIIKDETIYAFSSKYGIGASSSFFNLIKKASIDVLGDSIFRDLCICFNKMNQNTIDTVYHYGLNTILEISNYDNLYYLIKNEQYQDLNLNLILDRIRRLSDNEKIINYFPYSLTRFFTSEISRRLLDCQTSLEQINRISSNDFSIQLNLDNKKWHKGIIDYSVTSLKDSTIILDWRKSAINDISQSHGLLNYRISLNEKNQKI